MHGLYTNWNVSQLLQEDLEEKNHFSFSIGSCDLDVLHGAFKAGMEAAIWDVGKILK